ncbi:photoactive yellow protein [bacterium]|nr:MAG: photoactive yellow protein [bacterium]
MNAIAQITPFIPQNILQSIEFLTPEMADKLNFGVVKVDDNGTIQLYNKYNYEHFADFKSAHVIGKNYFSEVAPCSNNFIFSGRFNRGVQSGLLNTVFDYVFTYKLSPTKVRVHLYRDKKNANWILVKKI